VKCCDKEVIERFCPHCGKCTLTQKLLWIPKIKKRPVRFIQDLNEPPFEGKTPKFLWTLFLNQDKNKKPSLPIVPIHQKNAFLEDKLHDWDVYRKEYFKYHGCMAEHGVWLLLEFEK